MRELTPNSDALTNKAEALLKAGDPKAAQVPMFACLPMSVFSIPCESEAFVSRTLPTLWFSDGRPWYSRGQVPTCCPIRGNVSNLFLHAPLKGTAAAPGESPTCPMKFEAPPGRESVLIPWMHWENPSRGLPRLLQPALGHPSLRDICAWALARGWAVGQTWGHEAHDLLKRLGHHRAVERSTRMASALLQTEQWRTSASQANVDHGPGSRGAVLYILHGICYILYIIVYYIL